MNSSLRISFYIFILIIIDSSIIRSQTMSAVNSDYLPINPVNMDLSIDPNTDFYQYSNGAWLRNNPIPPEYSRWSSWSEVIERNNAKLRIILESAASQPGSTEGSNLKKLGDLYFTAMDTITIEQLGSSPLTEDLAMIDAIQSKEDFQGVFSYLKTFRTGGLFTFFAGQDDRNSQNVIFQIFQSGLGLPDKDYYLKDDERSRKIRASYQEFMKEMFTLIGNDESNSSIISDKVMEIETRLARNSMGRVEMRQAEATYHLMNLEELRSLTPEFSWDVLFSAIGLSDVSKFDKGINVGQPEFLKEVNRMLTDVSLDDWKNYLKWNLLRWSSDKLSSNFENASFDFYDKTLRGTEEQQPRWKQSLSFINGSMGEPLGQLFIKENFTPQTKAKAMEMVNNIKESFGERLKNNEWMSEQTKVEALKKLSTFKVNIGYPDQWKDYTGLNISRDSFYENMKNAAVYGMKLNLDKIGKPVMEEWFMLPQTVNASYNASKNEITFPAGIMQPPFFDPNADDAVNYGGIGSVIGHEITHGFDDQGRKYDGDGNLKDWWTEEDEKNFKVRADKLVKQFNKYAVLDSVYVNGELTLGENIADLGGLIVSYYALQKSLEGKEVNLINDFTPEQRFFLAFSQIWKINTRPDALRLQVNTDPHSPEEFRVIGTISNMIEFMKAYNGKPGDPMINDDNERVVIW